MTTFYLPYAIADKSSASEREQLFSQFDRHIADDTTRTWILIKNDNKSLNPTQEVLCQYVPNSVA